MEINEYENTMVQNLWDTAKAVLRGKCIAIQAYLKKQEKISNKKPNLTPKGAKKEQQIKPKTSRRKEMIKFRAEINEIETRKTIQLINKTRSWF